MFSLELITPNFTFNLIGETVEVTELQLIYIQKMKFLLVLLSTIRPTMFILNLKWFTLVTYFTVMAMEYAGGV